MFQYKTKYLTKVAQKYFFKKNVKISGLAIRSSVQIAVKKQKEV